jgi:hypothetical protein
MSDLSADVVDAHDAVTTIGCPVSNNLLEATYEKLDRALKDLDL